MIQHHYCTVLYLLTAVSSLIFVYYFLFSCGSLLCGSFTVFNMSCEDDLSGCGWFCGQRWTPVAAVLPVFMVESKWLSHQSNHDSFFGWFIKRWLVCFMCVCQFYKRSDFCLYELLDASVVFSSCAGWWDDRHRDGLWFLKDAHNISCVLQQQQLWASF